MATVPDLDAGPRRWRQVLSTASILAVIAGTVAAFVLSWGDSTRSWQRAERVRVAQVSAAAERSVLETALALRGASGMVGADGTVTHDQWNRYASEVSAGATPLALAYIEQVSATQRTAFEAKIGRPISTTSGHRLVPSPPEPSYLAIEYVWPPSGADQLLLGFDLASDPARALAVSNVLSTGREEVVAINVIGSGPALFAARPVVGPGGKSVGLISALFAAKDLTTRIAPFVPPGDGFSVTSLDGLVVAGDARITRAAAAATMTIPPSLTVRLHLPGSADRVLSIFILTGGLLLAAFLIAFNATGFRRERRLAVARATASLAEARTGRLLDVSSSLSRTRFPTDVARAAIDSGRLLGATGGLMVSVGTNGDTALTVLHSEGVTLGDPEEIESSAFGPAVQHSTACWMTSPGAWADGDGSITMLAPWADGAGAAIALPVIAGGAVVGGVGYAFAEPRSFDDTDRSLFASVAAQTGPALARAQLLEREHGIAETLQRRLLPARLPDVTGVTVAVRYQAATEGTTVGGDWYDAVALPNGRIALVVGDVVGKGPEGAAVMAQLRNATDAYLLSTASVASTLHALNEFAGSVNDAVCSTCVIATIDPRSRSLTYGRAGHPPPLVVTASGADYLSDGGTPPLGSSFGARPVETVRPLAVGDLVILYTDGLVERRDRGIDVGMDELALVAAELRGDDPETIADRLLEAMVPDGGDDDVALLVAVLNERAPRRRTRVGAPVAVRRR